MGRIRERPPSYQWTSVAVSILKREFVSGKTASIIRPLLPKDSAGRLPTRNAVIGKLHRLGLTRSGQVKERLPPIRGDLKEPVTVKRGSRPKTNTRHGPEAAPKPPKDLETFDKAIPVEQRKQLIELNGHACRWPIGDPRDKKRFFFCGAPVKEDDCPYCRAHAYFASRQYQPRS